MSGSMAERDLKGISMEALGGAQNAAIGKVTEMSAADTAIRDIRSILVSEHGRFSQSA